MCAEISQLGRDEHPGIQARHRYWVSSESKEG